MAGLPSIPASYLPLFENYWSQLEGSQTGDINAITAASFLKKSQLKEPLLHKIWDLSDPAGKGYLDKQGFFIALRLVSACQCGREPSLKSIHATDPPPKFIGIENTVWIIDANERSMYNTRFERLQPVNGLLAGEKVKPFLMSSQLPIDILGKIWGLSDMDRDGSLDADEFAIAMKLTSMVQKGEVLPLTLPQSLIPSTKASRLGLAPPTPGLTLSPRTPSPTFAKPASTSDWIITPDIKAKYDTYFAGIDKDHDGIITGDQARNLFMSSNLTQNVLAHVWRLCDIDGNGKLNQEQFALAMYLIAERVKGRELPNELSPQMIPPSKRKGINQLGGVGSNLSTSNVTSHVTTSTTLQHSSSTVTTSILQPTSSVLQSTTSSILQPTTSNTVLQPTNSGLMEPTTILQPTTSSTILQPSTSSTVLQPTNSGLMQPTTTTTLQPSTGGLLLQSTALSTTSSEFTSVSSLQPTISSTSNILSTTTAVGFSADFSAIRDLDTVSNEIENIKKSKYQLQQDIAMKQDALTKSKEEALSVKAELDESTRQRDQLEQQKRELQSQLEEISNQHAKMKGELNELKEICKNEKEEIESLKRQLQEKETNKVQKQNELSRLQQQYRDLKHEEESIKGKIETTRTEINSLENEHQTVQRDIDKVKDKLDQYRNQQQQLNLQLSTLANTTVSSNNILPPSDVQQPNLLSEPDAISARATAGSSSPVSSISGFSTASHQSEERERTDTLTAITDPFLSFPDPFNTSAAAGGLSALNTSSNVGGDFSFDPFGIGNFKVATPPNTTPSTTSLSIAVTTSTTDNKTFTVPTLSPDPFANSDPFSSDPFSSVTTPKASDQQSQLTSWGISPFSDPFGSSQSGSSDPFFTSDPFGSGTVDPFGDTSNPFGTSNSQVFGGGGLDPFASLTETPPTTTN